MSTDTLKQLGKYTITEVLGKGAMGVVYKGFDPHIKRTVAIKTVRRELAEADQAASLVARFANEAQAAGRLSHPGLVAVYEYGEQETLAYIVMEYVQGSGLDVYFKRGSRFDMVDIVSIMVQLLDALDYAHERGVVHRDIKPSNIMVMTNGKLKITDFGIAKIDSSELTQVGVVMGTPSYMAPEQYMGLSNIDRRADIFSAGVIFYQLLAGEKPFSGASEAVAYKICHEVPRLPSALAPDRNLEQFDAIVLKALEKKPEHRYQTAREFSDVLLKTYREPAPATVSEETIIHAAAPLPPHIEATSPSKAPTDTPLPGTTDFPSNWDAAVLQQVEQQLTQIVGPVARVMIKKAARAAGDIDTLYRMLAEDLANVQDRTEFLGTRTQLKGVSPSSAGTHLSSPPPTRSPAPALAQETVDQAARQLAPYLGPIAKVLAKKAANQALSRQDFYLRLAENIQDEKDKNRFLKDVGVDG